MNVGRLGGGIQVPLRRSDVEGGNVLEYLPVYYLPSFARCHEGS